MSKGVFNPVTEFEHERKRDIVDDPEVLKNLFLRVIERSLQDCTGRSLSLTKTQVSPQMKVRMKYESVRFLESEWGQDICEFVNMDRDSIIKAAKKYIAESDNGTGKKKYRSL